MFLNNFYRTLAVSKIVGRTGSTDATYFSTTGGEYTMYGHSDTNSISEAMHNMLKTGSPGSAGVVFGNGTTAVKANDYWLSGSVITTYTATYSSSYIYDKDGVTYTTLYTLTNTSTTDSITIGEVGLVWNYRYAGNNTYYTNTALVERTLLDTPIAIAPNGVGQVTYTIRINYPVL